MYLPPPEKACMMLGYGLEWNTRAVIQASSVLARAGDRICEPKPRYRSLFLVKILSRNDLSDAFVRAVWFGWLFLLRVPSECLILGGQLPRERIAKGALVIKLHRSQHVAGDSRMIRRCMCDKYPEGSLEIHVPQMFCPVRGLWEYIRRRVRREGKLFPEFPGTKDLKMKILVSTIQCQTTPNLLSA